MFFGFLTISGKEGVEGGGREHEDSELALESSALGLSGRSGMMGGRMSRQMISSSRPSDGVVLLRNPIFSASSAVVDVCLSFVLVFCVKSL